jgi:hypothetical protein
MPARVEIKTFCSKLWLISFRKKNYAFSWQEFGSSVFCPDISSLHNESKSGENCKVGHAKIFNLTAFCFARAKSDSLFIIVRHYLSSYASVSYMVHMWMLSAFLIGDIGNVVVLFCCLSMHESSFAFLVLNLIVSLETAPQ